jgi:hypothetical protein
MYELRKNIKKTTSEQKGDWKPIVFLFTDGVPTDETKYSISEWKQNWQKTANMVAISFGDEINTQDLKELTENVLHFKNVDAESYKNFFRWVTDSIKTSSVSVENNSSGFELAKLDGITISKIDLSKEEPVRQIVDPNFVVLAAKCQNNKRPYLMKYRKNISSYKIGGMELSTLSYRLVGAFQVDQSYFDLSDESAGSFKIRTEELMGAPTCPCCGNQFAFAICSCGKLHCIGDEEVSTCPWCGNQGSYGAGDEGFEVNRTQG